MSEPKLTRRQQAELALENPNMVRFLNTLSYAEGTEKHGYHTNFGGSRLADLSWHPNKVLGRTKDGVTTATGRYQFLGSTFNEQAKKLGLKDFGARSQDLAAVGLIMERGALNDVLNGDVTKAVYKLRHVWASLPDNPSKNQPHKTHAEIIDAWNRYGGKADLAFVHPSSEMHPMNGQQYDYSTTSPAPVATNATPLSPTNPPPVAINSTPASQQAVSSSDDLENAFAQFNALNHTQSPSMPMETAPAPSPRQKYDQRLAAAFGVTPDVGDGLPTHISDLVKSIYDETA